MSDILNTSLHSMKNAKLSQQRLWSCHETRLAHKDDLNNAPQSMCVSSHVSF